MTLNKYIRRLTDKLDRVCQQRKAYASQVARWHAGGSWRTSTAFFWPDWTFPPRGRKGKGGRSLPRNRP